MDAQKRLLTLFWSAIVMRKILKNCYTLSLGFLPCMARKSPLIYLLPPPLPLSIHRLHRSKILKMGLIGYYLVK
jgi:hypothetical protein